MGGDEGQNGPTIRRSPRKHQRNLFTTPKKEESTKQKIKRSKSLGTPKNKHASLAVGQKTPLVKCMTKFFT